MTSPLTSALEKLDQAITKLENTMEERVTKLEAQQRELFSQLDLERDRTKTIAKELDTVISQIEKTLQSNATVN